MEQDDITPDLYNPEFMEEDGDYNTLLGGISFDFWDLNEDLTPPLNLYNGCGPIMVLLNAFPPLLSV